MPGGFELVLDAGSHHINALFVEFNQLSLERRLDKLDHRLADDKAENQRDEEAEDAADHAHPQFFNVIAERHARMCEQVFVVGTVGHSGKRHGYTSVTMIDSASLVFMETRVAPMNETPRRGRRTAAR